MSGKPRAGGGGISVFGLKNEQGLFAWGGQLPGNPEKGGNTAAVLTNLNNPGGGELLEDGLQFSCEFHDKIINEIRSCGNMFLLRWLVSNSQPFSGPR